MLPGKTCWFLAASAMKRAVSIFWWVIQNPFPEVSQHVDQNLDAALAVSEVSQEELAWLQLSSRAVLPPTVQLQASLVQFSFGAVFQPWGPCAMFSMPRIAALPPGSGVGEEPLSSCCARSCPCSLSHLPGVKDTSGSRRGCSRRRPHLLPWHRCVPCRLRQCHRSNSTRGRSSSAGHTEIPAVPPQSWAFSCEMETRISLPAAKPAVTFGRGSNACGRNTPLL